MRQVVKAKPVSVQLAQPVTHIYFSLFIIIFLLSSFFNDIKHIPFYVLFAEAESKQTSCQGK